MSGWIYFLLFFVVCIFYFHVQQQWKTSEDLEIYEYEYSTYENFHETCKYKQPFLFFMYTHEPKPSELQELNIKDVRENKTKTRENEMLQLSFQSGYGLIETDQKSLFYSYRNHEGIQSDPSLLKWFTSFDSLLKPPLHFSTEFDLLYGSKKVHTTTTMYYESHTFLYLSSEMNKTFVRVKMTPYKSKAFFDIYSDYANYEFWSDYDLFNEFKSPQVKTIEFLLNPGQVLFIPPYWFYSIEFQDKEQELCLFRYTTYPNFLANAKHVLLYHIQQQNIHEIWMKPLYDSSEPPPYPKLENIEVGNDILNEVSTTLNIKKNEDEKCSQDVANHLIEQISAAK